MGLRRRPDTGEAVHACISRGVEFLLGTRDASGWWHDFTTLAGESDEWVTAYVGAALALFDDPRARSAARDAWALLETTDRPGWGYNRVAPPDADSTSWALRLAGAVGAERSEGATTARRFLARHVRPSGGVATYADDVAIRAFTRVPPDISFAGWCSEHPCVTGAAAGALDAAGRMQALGYLRTSQAPDGSWPAYWWTGRAYSTALAAQAVAASPLPEDAQRVRRAVLWARARLADGAGTPDAFTTAGLLRTVLNDEDGATAVVRLLTLQQPDGSWPSSAGLRIPPPGVTGPEEFDSWVAGAGGGGALVADHNAVFTTASAVGALASWQPSRA